MKKKIRYYVAMILLYASKPFAAIESWLWTKHRDLLHKNRDE